MKSEIVDVNETRRDLTIEVPTEVVNEAIGHAAAKLGKQARIPGFRPGKVPSNVIRQRFKPQIMQDVAEHLISKAVGDALTEKGVEPIDTPDIKDLVLEEGKPLTFKASFDVVPSFDPGDLSTIELEREVPLDHEGEPRSHLSGEVDVEWMAGGSIRPPGCVEGNCNCNVHGFDDGPRVAKRCHDFGIDRYLIAKDQPVFDLIVMLEEHLSALLQIRSCDARDEVPL